MSAERNLLFGMMALQAGLVSREQLLDAVRLWMSRKETPLGDVFRECGTLDDEQRGLLDGLVTQQMKKHGDAHKCLASLRIDPQTRRDVEQLTDPEVQADLASQRSVWPETNVPEEYATDVPGPGAASALPPSASWHRYRPMRAHARGGLGEVLVARDVELQREVALKQIQDRFADDVDSRKRFIREAEITGSLEHPGIVPVYGLCIHPDGRPLYAMRFIKGESLHHAIDRFHKADKQPGRDPSERSLALRGLVTRFVAVCNAVGFAHSRAVIHRDLKPGNVMLGDFGETLVVDWGLAKVLTEGEAPSKDLSALTRLRREDAVSTLQGEVMGTPAFMPPEQARGELQHMGPRSDVFALGATLYALLTGQPPYLGKDVLADAAACRFAPPRQVTRTVPPALEAVCLQAMAALPEQRYETGRELGEDVDRWLADEVVRAYGEPWPERMRRWGRRHRTLVTSAMVLLAAGVVALLVGLWAVGQEQRETAKERDKTAVERDKAIANESRALVAEKQATANFDRARQAVDECFGVAKDDPLFQGESMLNARKRLLGKTLLFYKDFVAQKADDAALLERQAEYLSHVAYITSEIGSKADALKSLEQARDIHLRLSQAHPKVHQYQTGLARTWHNLGMLQRQTGQPQEARRSYEQARDIHLRLSQAYPEVPQYQTDLAGALDNLGLLLSETGQLEEALKSREQFRDIQHGLSQAHPEDIQYQAGLARAWFNLGHVRNKRSEPREAFQSYEQARHLQLWLSQAYPEVPQYQTDLVDTWNELGTLQIATGQLQEALKSREQARDIQLRLSQAYPNVTQYQAELANTWHNLGMLQRETGQPQEALKSHEQARDIRLRLRQVYPEVTQYQVNLALTWNELGILQIATGQLQEALTSYEQARGIQLRLSKAHPEVTDYQAHLAGTLVNLSNLLRQTGQPKDGLASISQAIELLVAAHQRDPNHTVYRLYLRNAHLSRAETLAQLSRPLEAVADWDALLRLNTNAAERPFIHLGRADALARAGEYRRAMTEIDDPSRSKNLPGPAQYGLAGVAARSAGGVARDSTRPLPERVKQADLWSRQAVALLQLAANTGLFRDPANRAHLDQNPHLAFVRHHPDFVAFVRTLSPAPP